MATGSRPSSSDNEDRRQSLMCPLCLDIFIDPKILPCSHTFCLKCLEDLVSSESTLTFPCPYCRTEVTVPAGGVSAFRSNVYIRPEDLDLAREGTHCLTHPDQKLDLYCTQCELPVCLKCALVEHMLHTTRNLFDAAREARTHLSQVDDFLLATLTRTTRAVEVEQKERQDLQDKKAALQTVIRNKHGAVVAVADTCRDELLASLDNVCGPAERDVDAALATRTGHQLEVSQLRQRLQQALTTDKACSLVALAKEMREGMGIAKTMEDRTSVKRSAVTRPVLNSTFTLDTVMHNIKDFFGTVDTMELRLTPGEVLVEEQFTRRKGTDTAVFSLSPLDDGGVVVCYANFGSQNNTPSDLFDESGNRKGSLRNAFGKCSFKTRDNGKEICVKSSVSEINTYSKNKDHHTHHLKLCHCLQGKASIRRVKVTSDDPFKTEVVEEFTINVGPHRAFDVDGNEQFFAVVEEAQVPAQPRKVKLFQRNTADAMATYSAPSKPFNPSDVCFLTMGGKEVLTIADEAGDSVHVVHVVHVPEMGLRRFLTLQTVTLTFVRHLAPGCPKVVQPTALNTDHRGRLWVACGGGAVLTMSFLTS